LSEEQKKKIEANLKNYSKRYDAEDEELLMAADSELIESRNRQINVWNNWKRQNEEYAEQYFQFAKATLGEDKFAEAEYDIEIVKINHAVEVKEETYKQTSY